ncbi:hypothetical protein EW145_g4832 [Phellinidium pouzarii]|uniref:Uncharacterized protein n=1 Tax=Phellinidium pouzarii TaxID=167371 RepID=A0A4S4L2B6_9AGAM|nr:hypothetical protein EW145_g4832 [Phellinidium pouzarii]
MPPDTRQAQLEPSRALGHCFDLQASRRLQRLAPQTWMLCFRSNSSPDVMCSALQFCDLVMESRRASAENVRSLLEQQRLSQAEPYLMTRSLHSDPVEVALSNTAQTAIGQASSNDHEINFIFGSPEKENVAVVAPCMEWAFNPSKPGSAVTKPPSEDPYSASLANISSLEGNLYQEEGRVGDSTLGYAQVLPDVSLVCDFSNTSYLLICIASHSIILNQTNHEGQVLGQSGRSNYFYNNRTDLQSLSWLDFANFQETNGATKPHATYQLDNNTSSFDEGDRTSHIEDLHLTSGVPLYPVSGFNTGAIYNNVCITASDPVNFSPQPVTAIIKPTSEQSSLDYQQLSSISQGYEVSHENFNTRFPEPFVMQDQRIQLPRVTTTMAYVNEAWLYSYRGLQMSTGQSND